MKRIRFITMFLLFGALTSLIYVGVFAAANNLKNVNFSGTINVPANMLNVRVLGWAGTDTSGDADFDSRVDDDSWVLGNIAYDLSSENGNSVTSPYKYFTLRIINSGSIALTVQMKNTYTNDVLTTSAEDVILEDVLTARFEDGSGDNVNSVPVSSCAVDGTATEVNVRLRINLLQVVDEDIVCAMGYTLVITEVE